MTKIYYNKNEVKTTIESLSSEYEKLSDIINEMNQKKEKLSSFWDAIEAEKFLAQLNNVSSMFKKFQTKYDDYLKLINSVTEAYEKDENEFVSAIETIAASSK